MIQKEMIGDGVGTYNSHHEFFVPTTKVLLFSACFCLPLKCCTSDSELLKMPNTIKIQELASVPQHPVTHMAQLYKENRPHILYEVSHW